ncbi:hypothetical protein M404DRAFT_106923, partial [Pisolithus tinctorius Marx 270]
TNEDKSQAFAQVLFPPPPPQSLVPQDYSYPPLEVHPYKAPGPDGVANIVFQKSPVLASYSLHLFNTVFMLQTYYDPWRESTMVILCKPSKADYTTPKA